MRVVGRHKFEHMFAHISGDVKRVDGRITSPGGLTSVVGKLIGTTVSEIRFRQRREPYGLDRGRAVQKGPADAMHPVHNPAVRSEYDGVIKVDFAHESAMLDDTPYSWALPLVEPVHGINLADRVEAHMLDGQPLRQDDEPVDVPSILAFGAGPEVVLLPHRCSVSRLGAPTC